MDLRAVGLAFALPGVVLSLARGLPVSCYWDTRSRTESSRVAQQEWRLRGVL